VNSSLILDHVLESIVSGAVKISGATAGVICEVLPETRRSVVLASVGEDIVEMRRLFASADADLESPLFEAVKTKRQVYVPDTELMPPSLLRTELIRRGVLSAVCIPLLHSEEVVGGLIVRSSQKYMFSPDTIQSLSTFASQSVLAIVNARLFKALEERSGQLDLASRHKSQFLANMSHELRTPLNAIIGYSELLSEGMYGPLPERAGKVLERVLVNGRHLLSLINDVLDLSRIEAGEFKLAIGPYSPRSILEQVRATMTPIAERKGLILELNGPESPDVYRGDEVRITQVLMNLVGNALKFTDEGRVIVSVRREDRHLVYSVVDTGPGISLEDHERIFGEFQQVDSSTTKRVSGSGLGLAISRRISALHGGHIRVVSALGAGATFELVLPTDEVDEVGS
jgi:signal transduction histidine kinase